MNIIREKIIQKSKIEKQKEKLNELNDSDSYFETKSDPMRLLQATSAWTSRLNTIEHKPIEYLNLKTIAHKAVPAWRKQ
jgi:hypothetical protein